MCYSTDVTNWNDLAQYEKEIFPADTDGKTCGHEHPGYNYLYFASPSQIVPYYLIQGQRVCVRYCPTSADNGLKCKQAAGLGCSFGSGVEYYEN